MPIRREKQIKMQALVGSVKTMLEALGYDTKNQDLRDTPRRVAQTLYEELSDENFDKRKLFSTFASSDSAMVVLRNHKAFTRCPHHLERVLLTIDIGYLPNGKFLGLSKLARIADYYCRGLMLQEEIVSMIAEGIYDALNPLGVAVVAEGVHMCMQARGVETTGSVITSKMLGIYLNDSHEGIAAREEFFFLIRR